mmetsp:Transcript_15069/g.45177  ORF Transcript_15069/g.45177 Transcript_15069/m.45177 type:complete len:266 (+) Transcript_15069:1417-2214(+)
MLPSWLRFPSSAYSATMRSPKPSRRRPSTRRMPAIGEAVQATVSTSEASLAQALCSRQHQGWASMLSMQIRSSCASPRAWRICGRPVRTRLFTRPTSSIRVPPATRTVPCCNLRVLDRSTAKPAREPTSSSSATRGRCSQSLSRNSTACCSIQPSGPSATRGAATSGEDGGFVRGESADGEPRAGQMAVTTQERILPAVRARPPTSPPRRWSTSMSTVSPEEICRRNCSPKQRRPQPSSRQARTLRAFSWLSPYCPPSSIRSKSR